MGDVISLPSTLKPNTGIEFAGYTLMIYGSKQLFWSSVTDNNSSKKLGAIMLISGGICFDISKFYSQQRTENY